MILTLIIQVEFFFSQKGSVNNNNLDNYTGRKDFGNKSQTKEWARPVC